MIYLYYHNGSGNHGCEAIVRATKKILNTAEPVTLFSRYPDIDRKYKLDEIVTVLDDSPGQLHGIKRLLASMYRRLFHSNLIATYFQHENFFKQVNKSDICLSIGGDNYCYAGREILAYYNKILHMKGAKTVLWGCSFEPDDMTDEIGKDISRYNLITVRESISYNVLMKYNQNVQLISDPAFQLDSVHTAVPDFFNKGKVVGINLSPLLLKCERIEGITKDNYISLIQYILNDTEMNIALIPHVVMRNNDDRVILHELYKEFSDSNRIYVVEDCNCSELKGIISKCRFFVGARTHATIAAYSTGVPTLVVGYSVKAKGIAQEIFGSDKNYVIPVQNLTDRDDLVKAFQWLELNEGKISIKLERAIPEYCELALKGKSYLEELMFNN